MTTKKVTDQQVIDALKEHGSKNAAAKALGIARASVQDRVRSMTKRGWSPDHDMTHIVPDGFRLKGTSTLYGEDGEQKLQWVKSQPDEERQHAMMREAIAAMSESLPRLDPIERPKSQMFDTLMNCYVVTDYHLGMMAWHEESGADWDIKIAEETLVKWFSAAIALSPASSHAVFAQLGDLLHWDGMDAVTPTSGHALDADSRFQKVVRCAIRVIRRIIDMLLAKHETLHIVMADANHDPASGVWLREWLSAIYENEPRITVDSSADSYYCHEFGSTSLFFHHGHKRKVANIDHVFAGKFREVFGRTKHSFAHLGHLHSNELKESSLMLVERHRTLAAKDAYASTNGYLSGRDAKVITYHKEFGEVCRNTISPEMLS